MFEEDLWPTPLGFQHNVKLLWHICSKKCIIPWVHNKYWQEKPFSYQLKESVCLIQAIFMKSKQTTTLMFQNQFFIFLTYIEVKITTAVLTFIVYYGNFWTGPPVIIMIRANFVDVPIKSYTFITFAHDIISCNLQGGINTNPCCQYHL